MELWQVAAGLMSAMLHAGWNAAVKASPRPAEVMTAQMILAGMIGLPALFWTGLPAPESWIWIAITTSLNLVTVTALLRSYDLAGFGLAYPVIRALTVLFVVPMAAVVSGEMLSAFGFAGIGLIALSLIVLAAGNSGANAVPRSAFLWIVIGGAGTAIYVMCDAQGVRRSGAPIAYGIVGAAANAVVMSWWQSGVAKPWRLLADHWARALPMAVASMASYLLMLLILVSAPIAPSAALRDTSAIFAILIAVFWLKESLTRLRLLAILLTAAAVPLLRFS